MDQDLIAAADAESKYGVCLGNGEGTFRAPTIIVDSMAQRGAWLTLGDYNRDGRQDVGIGFSYCCVGGAGVPGAFGVMLSNSRLKVRPKRVRIQRMTSKWASCSTKGYVSFADDLLCEPRAFQDYVIVHELLHLRLPNHGKLFKSLLSVYIPSARRFGSLGKYEPLLRA